MTRSDGWRGGACRSVTSRGRRHHERRQGCAITNGGTSPLVSCSRSLILRDDPWWPLQVFEFAVRSLMAEARGNLLTHDDVQRMTEPLFALAHDARRAALAREAGR